MDISPFVEFYIASNPPLQPDGVKRVMALVEEWNAEASCPLDIENEQFFHVKAKQEQRKHFLEILYEPEVPWFKVLTLVYWQAEVADVVEGALARLVDDCQISDRALGDPTNGLRHDIISSSQATIPWAKFSASQKDYERAFDSYRYPEDMQALLHKHVWTGLVMEKGYTLQTLLGLPDVWHLLGFHNSLECLKQLLGCYISHNVRGTTLYIGSNTGEHAIIKAVAVLNNLLQCVATFSDHLHHLIYNESEGKTKFVYNYLSHIGLLQTTYAANQDMKTETRLLKSAVTIRTAERIKDSWVSDSTTYPCKEGIRANETKPFSAFNGYRYLRKEASPISGLLKEAEALILQNHDGSVIPAMGTALIDRLPLNMPLETDITSRPSPGFPNQDASNGLQSEDLIFFDEVVDHTQGQPSSAYQQSLLDDCAPLTLMEPMIVSSANATLPSEVIHNLLGPRLNPPRAYANNYLQSGRNDNQSLPGSQTNCLVPPRQCGMAKTISLSEHPHIDGETARSLDERIQSLASMMQFLHGNATIRLKFGRFYFVNVNAADVALRSGPYWRMAEILHHLEDATPSGNLRFSTVLSTIGPDAEIIAGTISPIPMWTKPVIEVILQITCRFKGDTFIVEINANTFDYTCQGPVHELGSVLIHCPRHPWDMKVCGLSSRNLDRSAIHRIFGQIIVNSLQIFPVRNAIRTIELTANEKLGLVIEGAAIRHAAKYSNTNMTDSNLTITMTQKLSPGDVRDNRRKWTVFQSRDNSNPNVWFEAYLNSSKMERIMQENSELSIGGRSSWNSQDLLSQGLFVSLYGPALKMISSLDKIGRYNNNGRQSEGGLTFGDSLAEEDAREGRKYFW